MKFTSLIMLLVVVKTQASYFDDFRGAMSSVENAFGKLLNDVVSDVKTTVHCTILAMEQVLAVNGVMPEPLPNKECYKDDSDIKFDIDTTKSNRNSYSARNAAQEIHSSISKVNKTLSHILDNTGHERIEDLKRELKHESNRLAEVSFLLRKELEKISHRMKKEFKNIDLDSDETSLDNIWNNMKILYEVEKNDKNASKEIGQVLNEALDVLHVNTRSKVKSDEEKINVIMKELEHESINNNVLNNTTHRELSQLEEEQSALHNNIGFNLLPGDISKNIKDVTTRTLTNVNDVVLEALTNVKDAASETLMNVKDAASETLMNVKDLASETSTNVTDVTSVALTNVEDVASVALMKVKDAASETLVKDVASETLTNVKDVTSVALTNVEDVASETLMNVKDAASETLMTVKDAASETLTNVKNVTSVALTNVEDVASETLMNVKDVASETLMNIKDAASETLKNVKDVTSVALTNVEDVASETLMNVKDAASETLMNVKDAASETLTNVKDVTSMALTNVEDVASETLTNVKDVTSVALSNIKDDKIVKDVAKKAFRQNNKVIKQVAEYINDKSYSFVTSNSHSEETRIKNDVPSLNKNLDVISSFNFGDSNTEDGIKGIEEAMGDFKEAAETQALLDNFFVKQQGTNAFENPNLFDNF